jgi:hypothetical protein
VTAWLTTREPVVPGRVYLAAVVLTRDPAALPDRPRVGVAATSDGHEVTAFWPDGTSDRVVLPALPASSKEPP